MVYRIDDHVMTVPIAPTPEQPFGVSRVLFTGRYQSTALPHYDVTTDGQRFVMIKPIASELDGRTIRLVDGWFGDFMRGGPSSR